MKMAVTWKRSPDGSWSREPTGWSPTTRDDFRGRLYRRRSTSGSYDVVFEVVNVKTGQIVCSDDTGWEAATHDLNRLLTVLQRDVMAVRTAWSRGFLRADLKVSS